MSVLPAAGAAYVATDFEKPRDAEEDIKEVCAWLEGTGVDLTREIGRGAFGRVYAVQEDIFATPTVAKCFFGISKEEERAKKSALRELRALNDLREGGIVHTARVVEGHRAPKDSKVFCAVIFMEYYGETLRRGFDEGEVRSINWIETWWKKALEALKGFKESNKAHTDICLKNATERGLIDMGLTYEGGTLVGKNEVQKRRYRSPEGILGGWITGSLDMWALGVMIYEIITGERFMCRLEEKEGVDARNLHIIQARLGQIMALNENGSIQIDPEIFYKDKDGKWKLRSLDEELPAISTIDGAFKKAGLERGYSKKRMAQALDLVKQMLQYDPQKRISASEALRHPFFCSEYAEDISFTIKRGFQGGYRGSLQISSQSSNEPPLCAIDLSEVYGKECFHFAGKPGVYCVTISNDNGCLNINWEFSRRNGCLVRQIVNASELARKILYPPFQKVEEEKAGS